MKDRQVLILAVLAIVFYLWWKKNRSVVATTSPTTGRGAGRTAFAPSTVSSTASTTPRMTRQPIGLTQANAGNGTGFISAPVRAISRLNSATLRNIGTGFTNAVSSRAWSGAGTAGISPTWPTNAVRSNGTTVRTGSGLVQVPSYTAVPTVTRAAGGAGSVIFLGRR